MTQASDSAEKLTLTDADVDGVLSDAAFEEAAATVTAQSSVVLAVAAVTAHGTDCRRQRSRTTCQPNAIQFTCFISVLNRPRYGSCPSVCLPRTGC